MAEGMDAKVLKSEYRMLKAEVRSPKRKTSLFIDI